MKSFLAIFLINFSAEAVSWITGEYKLELEKDSLGNWVTSNCLKKCDIDELASSYIKTHPLTADDLRGGKNPGSVLCKKMSGKVIYLRLNQEEAAFCNLRNETVSLARLAQMIP
jgi:hypothetical protein